MPHLSQPPRLVIFDCDGVLVDSEPIFLSVLHRYLCRSGADLSHNDCCAQFLGKSKLDVENYLLAQGLSIPADWPDAFYAQAMTELQRDCTAIDGVEDVLRRLTRADIPFCTASNGLRDKIELTLSHTGLLHYFEDRIYSAYDIGRSKPAPDVFLHAARVHGIAPQHCVVIEDSPSGLQAARAAGMTCFAYVEAEAAQPTDNEATLFSSMRDLPRLLGLQ